MVNKDLLKFVREAKKRGFDDLDIRKPLLADGWSLADVESALVTVNKNIKIKHFKFKNRVELFLDNDLLTVLDKRAKKSFFTIPELIEDILRRSCLTSLKKKKPYQPKIDDLLVSVFSRAPTGPKKKSKS